MCSGLEGILIDWQGGFLGSISNDLMWLLPPFLEAGAGLEEALLHYATQVDIIYTLSTVYLHIYSTQLLYVLGSFDTQPEHSLPQDTAELVRIIKRGFIMEFLNVVIIKYAVYRVDRYDLV